MQFVVRQVVVLQSLSYLLHQQFFNFLVIHHRRDKKCNIWCAVENQEFLTELLPFVTDMCNTSLSEG